MPLLSMARCSSVVVLPVLLKLYTALICKTFIASPLKFFFSYTFNL